MWASEQSNMARPLPATSALAFETFNLLHEDTALCGAAGATHFRLISLTCSGPFPGRSQHREGRARRQLPSRWLPQPPCRLPLPKKICSASWRSRSRRRGRGRWERASACASLYAGLGSPLDLGSVSLAHASDWRCSIPTSTAAATAPLQPTVLAHTVASGDSPPPPTCHVACRRRHTSWEAW